MALKGMNLGKPTGTDYSKHLEAKPIISTTTVSKSYKKEEVPGAGQSESKTEHPGVYTNGASLYVEGSRTINLGNYESARITVGINIPLLQASPEELNIAYEWGSTWVSSHIEEAVSEAKS